MPGHHAGKSRCLAPGASPCQRVAGPEPAGKAAQAQSSQSTRRLRAVRHVNCRGSLARVQRLVAGDRREVVVLLDGVLAHLGGHAAHAPPVSLLAVERARLRDRTEAHRALRELLLALAGGRAGRGEQAG